MTYTLCIEASTNVGSVALLHSGDIVAERLVNKDKDGDHLMPAISDCLAEAGVSVNKLSRIICGAGPGSFTSLRISAAIAKGLAVGAGCELYAVASQSLMSSDNESEHVSHPHAREAAKQLKAIVESGPVNIVSWEPDYGQKPLAQVKWEAEHGKPLEV